MIKQLLTVTTSTASYPVIVADGALEELPKQLADAGLRGALWLVSDEHVYPLYAPALVEQLSAAGFTVHTFQVPAGESSKALDQLAQLYNWLIGGGVERRDTLLALGGGVVGDLAGYAAASVLRGISLVQLPTTLLAMIDSAIGGKTGINHPLGKNLIGAFHQPRLVLADTRTLASLPPRELCAGWAEVIKHGVIRDVGLFELLEQQIAAYPALSSDGSLLNTQNARLIERAAAVKVAVVSADEREQGERIILNYGHTLGHALEAVAGYGTLLHGEAVAIGMQAAARIAERLGIFPAAAVARQQALLEAFGLPTVFPTDCDPEQLLNLTLRDKKVRSGRVRWVLPNAIGSVVVRDDVPEHTVREVITSA